MTERLGHLQLFGKVRVEDQRFTFDDVDGEVAPICRRNLTAQKPLKLLRNAPAVLR